MITKADDPLLAGPTGFHQTIKDLEDAQDRFTRTMGFGTGAIATAVFVQLALCGETVGITCASAVITGLVGAAGATLTGAGLIAFDLIPAFNNVKRAFTTLDSNRP